MPNLKNITSPLLIIGSRRSGTSWLHETLAQHPQVQYILENHLLLHIYNQIYKSYWSEGYLYRYPEYNEPLRQKRTIAILRNTVSTLFPSEQPYWVHKLEHSLPWEFVLKLFPNAKYIHIIRSPVTTIPSMLEYFQDLPRYQKIEGAEQAYIKAQNQALALRDAGVPYLLVHQEDIRQNAKAVWQNIQTFCELPPMELPTEVLEKEVTPSPSTKGQVKGGRKPFEWSQLSQPVWEIGRQLGYEPPEGVQPRSELQTLPEEHETIEEYRRFYPAMLQQNKQLMERVQWLESQCQAWQEKAEKTAQDWQAAQDWIQKLQQGKNWLEGELSASVSYAQSLEKSDQSTSKK